MAVKAAVSPKLLPDVNTIYCCVSSAWRWALGRCDLTNLKSLLAIKEKIKWPETLWNFKFKIENIQENSDYRDTLGSDRDWYAYDSIQLKEGPEIPISNLKWSKQSNICMVLHIVGTGFFGTLSTSFLK